MTTHSPSEMGIQSSITVSDSWTREASLLPGELHSGIFKFKLIGEGIDLKIT